MNKTVVLPQAIKNVSTDAMRMFLILSDLKSISKTAQLVSRSQPAISLQLKKLENTLNTTLFFRNKGVFTLTRDGKIFLDYAEKIINLNDALLDELSHVAHRQIVRIGIPNDFIERIWLDTLSKFRDAHPEIRFEVYEDLSVNLISMLHQNRLDIAIALLPKVGGQYCIYSVEKSLFWAGNKKHQKKEAVGLIACFNGCSYRVAMESALRQANISYQVILTSNNFYTIYDAINQGIGVSALLSNQRNIQNYAHKRINYLPEMENLHLGLHIKSVNITKEVEVLTQQIKVLL